MAPPGLTPGQTFGGFVVDSNTQPSPPITLPPHLHKRFASRGVPCFALAACYRLTDDGQVVHGFALVTERYLWIVEVQAGTEDAQSPNMNVSLGLELRHIQDLIAFGDSCTTVMIRPTAAVAGTTPCAAIDFVDDPLNAPATPHAFVIALMRTAKCYAYHTIKMVVRPGDEDPRVWGGLGRAGPSESVRAASPSNAGRIARGWNAAPVYGYRSRTPQKEARGRWFQNEPALGGVQRANVARSPTPPRPPLRAYERDPAPQGRAAARARSPASPGVSESGGRRASAPGHQVGYQQADPPSAHPSTPPQVVYQPPPITVIINNQDGGREVYAPAQDEAASSPARARARARAPSTDAVAPTHTWSDYLSSYTREAFPPQHRLPSPTVYDLPRSSSPPGRLRRAIFDRPAASRSSSPPTVVPALAHSPPAPVLPWGSPWRGAAPELQPHPLLGQRAFTPPRRSLSPARTARVSPAFTPNVHELT